MKTRLPTTLTATAAVLGCAGSLHASPLTVDGRLDDWGVRVGDHNTSNISTPLAPSTVNAIPLSCFGGSAMCEDQNDMSNAHALGPHWGGQDYDVEFMGVRREGGRIFIGIASGLRPDNGVSLYGPGDLFLRIDGVAYAIEIGGGAGGSAASAAALLGAQAGSTYTLNGSGYTTGMAAHSALQTAGSIWSASDINYVTDPITHTVNTQFSLKAGTTALDRIATADFIFTRNQTPDTENGGYLAQHSVIELSFDAALFGAPNEIEAYWGPVCSNDGLMVYGNVAGPGVDGFAVPEPGSLALFTLGLAGFQRSRKKPN